MRTSASPLALLCCYLLAAFAAAQSQTPSQNAPVVSTILSTNVGLAPNHQLTTQIVTSLVTLNPPSPTDAAGGGNGSVSGNTTLGGSQGNGTGNGSDSSGVRTTKVTPSNLPTANPKVDGGGNPAGAPSPGGGAGAYGPPDSYIAGALVHRVDAALVAMALVAGAVGLVALL